MATLYDTIRNQYGLSNSNDIYKKQQSLYQGLGSPMGNYAGSAAQNNYLLQNQGRWGAPQAQTPGASVPNAGSGGLINQYVNSVLPPGGVKTPTAFEQVVPRDNIVNSNLVQQWANSRVMPDVQRQQAVAQQGLMNSLGSSGGLRFGTANTYQQQLKDAYSRQAQDEAQLFYQTGMNNLNSYYNDLMTQYYKDPNTFSYTPIDVTKFLGQ